MFGCSAKSKIVVQNEKTYITEVKRRPMFDALVTIFFVIGFVNVEKVKERNKVVYSGAGFPNRIKTIELVK